MRSSSITRSVQASWSGATRTSFHDTAARGSASSRFSCPRGFREPERKPWKVRRCFRPSGSSTGRRRSPGCGRSAMTPTALMGVQFTFSLVVFALVARWYITPSLNARPLNEALVPLFLAHTLRYLPSSAFAPGQIDPRVPRDAMAAIAYGDLASAVLALVAALWLYYGFRD